MLGWKEYTIGELAIVKGGKRLPKGVNLITERNSHPYIRIRDLTEKTIELKSSYEYVDDDTQKSISRYIVNAGDILISIVGTIGLIAVVGNTLHGANLTENCVKLIDISDNVDREYLYYFLVSSMGQDEIRKGTVGAVQPKLPIKNIQSIKVPLPPIWIQKKISGLLSLIDSKIAFNTAINENLEQQAQAYFVDLFITNADPNWRIGTISDLGNVVGGGTPSKKVEEYYTSDGIAWITPKDLSNDKSKFVAHGETDITELGLTKSSATLMPKGTVLFSSRAPIGYIAIADGQICTNQGFKSIIPFDNVGTAFVYYFLKENLSAIENVASGSTFKEVSGSTMKIFTAIIPDNDTLAEFQRFCSPLFEQQRALEYENRSLSSIRDTLLPKLMSGEIDVSAVKI